MLGHPDLTVQPHTISCAVQYDNHMRLSTPTLTATLVLFQVQESHVGLVAAALDKTI